MFKKLIIVTIFISIFSFKELYANSVLVTGANRGLGLELTKQYLNDGWDVIATSRTPNDDIELFNLKNQYSSLRIEKLDVTDHGNIKNLVKILSGVPIDIIINNAGILGDPSKQQFGNLDFNNANNIFKTNTFAPLMIAEAFIDNIKLGNLKKIINISSIVGSIELTTGNIYFYRASKTALNMLMKNLSLHLKNQGIIIGLIHPGVVDTDMTARFNIKKVSVNESVKGIREVIKNYTMKETGSFFDYKGNSLPW